MGNTGGILGARRRWKPVASNSICGSASQVMGPEAVIHLPKDQPALGQLYG